MKRCQIGVGGRGALDAAHDILAECYGTLGALLDEAERVRAENERLRDWIAEEGKRTDTCTENVLMRICEDCRCGKLKTPNAQHEPGP